MGKLFKVILILIVIYFFGFLNALYNDKDSNEKILQIKIEQGDTASVVGGKLQDAGLVKSRWSWAFNWYGGAKGYDRRMKIGTVDLPQGASIATIWELMKNPANSTFRLTFIEGWNLRDIKNYLKEMDISGAGDLYNVTGEPGKDFRKHPNALPASFKKNEIFGSAYGAAENGAPNGATLEGFIFPDTYEFFADATAQEIIQKAHDEMTKKIPSVWGAEVKKQGKNWYEIITMASVIEDEVRGAGDRKIVSGIFWKRVENGWGLQADSTVNYITGGKDPSVSSSDLKTDSPYNTYKYKGLPLGPISSPSLNAIEAAIFPEKTAYWYFLTTPTGEVKYAKTLEEHAANRKYLK